MPSADAWSCTQYRNEPVWQEPHLPKRRPYRLVRKIHTVQSLPPFCRRTAKEKHRPLAPCRLASTQRHIRRCQACPQAYRGSGKIPEHCLHKPPAPFWQAASKLPVPAQPKQTPRKEALQIPLEWPGDIVFQDAAANPCDYQIAFPDKNDLPYELPIASPFPLTTPHHPATYWRSG